MTNHDIIGLVLDESRGRIYYVATSTGYLDIIYYAGLDGQNSTFIAWDTGSGRCYSQLNGMDINRRTGVVTWADYDGGSCYQGSGPTTYLKSFNPANGAISFDKREYGSDHDTERAPGTR